MSEPTWFVCYWDGCRMNTPAATSFERWLQLHGHGLIVDMRATAQQHAAIVRALRLAFEAGRDAK